MLLRAEMLGDLGLAPTRLAPVLQAQRRHEEGAAAAANSVVSSLGGALGSVSSVDSLTSQSPSATSSGEPCMLLGWGP